MLFLYWKFASGLMYVLLIIVFNMSLKIMYNSLLGATVKVSNATINQIFDIGSYITWFRCR